MYNDNFDSTIRFAPLLSPPSLKIEPNTFKLKISPPLPSKTLESNRPLEGNFILFKFCKILAKN